MSIKVKEIGKATRFFACVDDGRYERDINTFMFAGDIYMKIPAIKSEREWNDRTFNYESTKRNAVCLNDGHTCWFEDDTIVRLIDIEINWTDHLEER